jgi:tellurite resistance protein TehA-like permease
LSTSAGLAADAALADTMNKSMVLFGIPMWGFAMFWISLATLLTVHAMRRGMRFALSWWSFTFPVGTFVTGTTQLAVHTDLLLFRVMAVIAYLALLGSWMTVAARTLRTVVHGDARRLSAAVGPVEPHKDSMG